jgi:hypothetical protein
MSDPYAFWRAQLAGESPEVTPGTPHAGFYRGGSSGDAYKRKFPETYISIWEENGEWIARTDYPDGRIVTQRGWAVDEFVFPRCCRNAVSYEEYLEKVSKP